MTELEHAVKSSRRLADKTKGDYVYWVKRFILFAGSDPRGWTAKAANAWSSSLNNHSEAAPGANTAISALQFASKRYAAEQEMPALDFARYVERFQVQKKKQSRKPKVLTLDAARTLVTSCRGNHPLDLRDRAIIVLAIRSGLRRAGLCSVPLALQPPYIHAVMKGGDEHSFVADPEVWAVLAPWQQWLAGQDPAKGALFRSVGRQNYLGKWAVGTSFSPSSVGRIVRSRAKAAGLHGVHPHMFRHTFISWCRAAGVPDWRIMSVTGHTMRADVAAILNTYTKDVDAERDPVGGYLPSLL